MKLKYGRFEKLDYLKTGHYDKKTFAIRHGVAGYYHRISWCSLLGYRHYPQFLKLHHYLWYVRENSFEGGDRQFWDYLLISISLCVVLLTLLYSVYFLVWPKENRPDHIKYQIIEDEKDY